MSCSSSEELSHIVNMKELHFCQESCDLVALLVLLCKENQDLNHPSPSCCLSNYHLIKKKKKQKQKQNLHFQGKKKEI